MSSCPKCKSSNVTEGTACKANMRLCNDCNYYWDINDPENGTYKKKDEEQQQKKGGGCCGKGAKAECDKNKKEEEKKKKGGGCCGKGAKAECQKQEEPSPPKIPSIKGMCAQLPAIVNPIMPSGIEIVNFVQSVIEDYNAVSSVTYPPNCSQLKMMAGMVNKYSGFVSQFA